jgi:ribosome-associated protein
MKESTMTFTLKEEYIELYKLLKLMTDVENGAEAKLLISSGHVKRDGIMETRKRAKIRNGETITLSEYTIKVVAE